MKNFFFAILATFVYLFIGQTVMAQTSGYIGKKNLISINGVANFPFSYNFFVLGELEGAHGKYNYSNGRFTQAKNIFSAGTSASICRVLSSRYAIGFEGRLLNFKTITPANLNEPAEGLYYIHSVVKSSFVRVSETSFSPFVEWTKKGGLMPIGLVQQIGLNFSILQLKQIGRQHAILYENNTNSPIEQVSNKLPEQLQDFRMSAVGVNYKLQLRVPINNSLLFSVGVRYRLTLQTADISPFSSSYKGTYFDRIELKQSVRQSLAWNVAHIESGFSFSF